MFSDHQPSGGTHDEKRDKKTKPDKRNIFTLIISMQWRFEQIVNMGNKNQTRVEITHFVGVTKKYFVSFSLQKVTKKGREQNKKRFQLRSRKVAST